MNRTFKVGDHVRWNSEAGHVTGKIIKVHTRDTDYKGLQASLQPGGSAIRDQERQE
jgi:hypothetical protein